MAGSSIDTRRPSAGSGSTPETLGFYLYRRNLEDLADFLQSIVESRVEAMEPAPMLDIIAGLLAETPLLAGQIEQVADLLAARP